MMRSEHQLCARLQTDMLVRFFFDLSLEAQVFDASTLSNDHAQLLVHEAVDLFVSEMAKLPPATAG